MPHGRSVSGENPLAIRISGMNRFEKKQPLPVPKKTKTEQTKIAAPAEAVTEAAKPIEAPAAKKTAVKKTTAKKVTSAKSAAKKTGAKKAVKKSATVAKQPVEPTDDEIRIRAYFIAERRVQMSLGGDPNNDWIQAREELIAELGNGSANGNGSH